MSDTSSHAPASGSARTASEQPPAKRRRTAQACGPCRTKKTKCDGLHPSCTPCISAKQPCSYPLESSALDPTKVLISKSLLEGLEARIKSLEQTNVPKLPESTPSLNGRPGAGSRDISADQPLEMSSGHDMSGPFDMMTEMMDDQGSYSDFAAPNTSAYIPQLGAAGLDPATARSGLGQVGSRDTNGNGAMFGIHSPKRTDSGRWSSGPLPSPPAPTAGPALGPIKAVRFPEDAGAAMNRAVSSGGAGLMPSADGMGILPPINENVGSGIGTGSSHAKPSPMASEFYGDTSGIIFHSLLLDTILPGSRCLFSTDEDPSAAMGVSLASGEATGFLGLGPRGPHTGEFFAMMSDLPSQAEAEQMWEFFEKRTYPIYPFVDLEGLKASYSHLLRDTQRGRFGKTGPDCLTNAETQPVLALHFLVFALVQSLSNIDLAGKEVYRVSLHLLRKHLDWPHSIIKVQALLMGTLLMQGVDCPSHGWDVLGYAVRSAYAIGLHDPRAQRKSSDRDKETRSRVWWACLTLDRLLTISLGRPSSISTGVTAVPLPAVRPHENPIACVFFKESIGLFTRLSDLISDPPFLLSQWRSNTASIQAAAAAVARLEREYAEWFDSIDPALAVPGAAGSPAEPLAYVLALRGCTARLLLHRPIVLGAIRQHNGLQSRPASPVQDERRSKRRLNDQLGRDISFGISLAAVIETSVLTVKMLRESSQLDFNMSAPWYQLFYAMNAFMSLISTFLLDLTPWAMFIKTPSQDILDSVRTSRNLVQRLADQYDRPNAKRALWIMDRLLQATVSPVPPVGNYANTSTHDIGQDPMEPDAVEAASRRLQADNTVSLNDAPMGAAIELQDLPHLDFQSLYQDLDLPAGLDFQWSQTEWLGGEPTMSNLAAFEW